MELNYEDCLSLRGS